MNNEEQRRKNLFQARCYESKVVDPDGNVHTVFNQKEFADKHGLQHAALNKVINGKRPSHRNWTQYADKKDPLNNHHSG